MKARQQSKRDAKNMQANRAGDKLRAKTGIKAGSPSITYTDVVNNKEFQDDWSRQV